MRRRTATARTAPPDLIIADLDGTLTRVSNVTARIASVSDRWDMPVSAAAVWAYGRFKKACDKVGVDRNRLNEFKSNMMGMLAKEQEDTYFILTAAAENNIPCRVLSNGPQKWGQYVLKSLNFDIFIQKAVFREEMGCLKPDPRSLKNVLEGFASAARKPSIWIFGDRETDVTLAWNAAAVLPYRFTPVAIAGTRAADIIHAANCNDIGGCPPGIVFETQYDMSRAIDPGYEDRLQKYVRRRDKDYGIIDSRPSP